MVEQLAEDVACVADRASCRVPEEQEAQAERLALCEPGQEGEGAPPCDEPCELREGHGEEASECALVEAPRVEEVV